MVKGKSFCPICGEQVSNRYKKAHMLTHESPANDAKKAPVLSDEALEELCSQYNLATKGSVESMDKAMLNDLLDLVDDGSSAQESPKDSPSKPKSTNVSPSTVKPTTTVKTPSIMFCNDKWLTNIYNPIAPCGYVDTSDNEYLKKCRFAFLNRVLSEYKAFYTIISAIEKDHNYYGFLIPFFGYANHELSKEQRDAFKAEHKDLCSESDGNYYIPFTGCGFNIYKTGLALFDFDFKTYTYTYSGGETVGAPVVVKYIEDTAIITTFFDKLFGAIDYAKVLDVITKSNGHHIYCRWDGSLTALTKNTVDKGCKQCIGTSLDKPPYDGEYKEYWIELDIKVPIDTDKRNGIVPFPGTVCFNKRGDKATYKLNSRCTESDISKLWSFKELNTKIASVYTELDYIAWNNNELKSLPLDEKVKAIKRDPEATEQDKMYAELLAWLDNPLEDGDESMAEIGAIINGSSLINDDNAITFTDELIDAIIKGFSQMIIHGNHHVSAAKSETGKAQPGQYVLRTAINRLTLDEDIRSKLLDGIYNTAALTPHAKSGWNSSISFNDKDWSVEVQRNALKCITSWIRSNNPKYYEDELAGKLYRPGKDYFDDRTHMFTWQEFQERLDSNVYTSISTLMHDLAKVLAINTLAAGGRGYFVKRWFKEHKLCERSRYNDFLYEPNNGPSVASMLDTTITVPTSAAEKERQRLGKRKVTDFKEVHVGSLLKKAEYRKYLASYRGYALWSEDKEVLSLFKPPAGKYDKEIVEFFIELMRSRVVNFKAWEEEFASHAYRLRNNGVFIPKYFIHVDPKGHAGKSFNAAAFAQVYGTRFSNAGATVADMVDTYNSWIFDYLYINFEEVQYSNGKGFDISDKLKQLTTKNGSKRAMYRVAETAEHKALISINTNQKDLYGLVNGDPADLRRLVIIEFKEITAEEIAKWEYIVDATIHDPDFGYSLFHYLAYDYKIPDWFKPTEHCTPDIRDEYIHRVKGENENQISRWFSWLMSKPIAEDDNTFALRESVLLKNIPESCENWHNDWFLRTTLSKDIGEVAVQSKTVIWNSFEHFYGKDRKYNQTRLFKDLKEVYGFTEHRVRLYGPNTNALYSLYIPIDKLNELREKYGGISQNNDNDEDVLDIEPLK